MCTNLMQITWMCTNLMQITWMCMNLMQITWICTTFSVSYSYKSTCVCVCVYAWVWCPLTVSDFSYVVHVCGFRGLPPVVVKPFGQLLSGPTTTKRRRGRQPSRWINSLRSSRSLTICPHCRSTLIPFLLNPLWTEFFFSSFFGT